MIASTANRKVPATGQVNTVFYRHIRCLFCLFSSVRKLVWSRINRNKKITRGGKLDESIVKLENTNTVFKLRTFMYRIFDKIIFERNLIFSIDLHEGSWISCFRAWYNRTLTTSSSQPLFVCVSVNCYCRALNQIGWKAKQAPFSWIYNCTTFRNISTVSLYTCTCKYWFNTWQDTVIILLPH